MSECSDSDGVNYNSKGNVSLKVDGNVNVVDDYCNENKVVEMICNTDGTASKLDQVCDNGCLDGKCVASTSSSSGGGSSGGSSGGGSSGSSSGSGGGYSAGSSRSPSTTSTTTAGTSSASPVVNTPAPTTTSSNQNTESNNEASAKNGCKENSECASKVCLNGECVGTIPNSATTVQSRRSFIEMVCSIANPFDERGYKSCLRFFGKGKVKN